MLTLRSMPYVSWAITDIDVEFSGHIKISIAYGHYVITFLKDRRVLTIHKGSLDCGL